MENNNLLKIFRQKFLRNAKHAISARGSSVDQQNALAPIRRVGSCKEGATGRRSDIGVFRLAPELSEHIMTWPDNYHLLGDKGFRLMKAS